MKKLIASVIAGAALLTGTAACTQNGDGVGRISYEVEAVYDDNGTPRSVLSDTTLLVRVGTSREGTQVRDGATGGWLVLPWQLSGDFGPPIRRQFTYDQRTTKAEDISLTVKATIQAPPGTHFKCVLLDTAEYAFKQDEVVIGVDGIGTVSCIS